MAFPWCRHQIFDPNEAHPDSKYESISCSLPVCTPYSCHAATSSTLLSILLITNGIASRKLRIKRQLIDKCRTASCRYVLLVRMHYEVKWKEDLVLFLRSIMHEISEAGMHMYLLIEVSLHCLGAGLHDTPCCLLCCERHVSGSEGGTASFFQSCLSLIGRVMSLYCGA